MVNLRKAAKGQMCQIRIPGYCNHNPETSVLAHYRLAGTCGTATKPHDMQAAIACSSCHDLIDGRVKTSDYTKEELRLMHAEGVFAHKKSGERKVIYDLPNEYRKKRRTPSPHHVGKCLDSGKTTYVGALVVYWRWQVREYVQSVVGIQKTDENSH